MARHQCKLQNTKTRLNHKKAFKSQESKFSLNIIKNIEIRIKKSLQKDYKAYSEKAEKAKEMDLH